MLKQIKIYSSFHELKQAEIDYISELSYYKRLENAMSLIKNVYSNQIAVNKKSNRIRIISSK